MVIKINSCLLPKKESHPVWQSGFIERGRDPRELATVTAAANWLKHPLSSHAHNSPPSLGFLCNAAND
jgi:hypothetical protein